MSHPFVERLIRIVRNELLDQTLFWNANDLQNKLDEFQHYFNTYRAHMGLDGSTPAQVAEAIKSKVIRVNYFRWKKHCRGLFQLPMAA